MKSKHHILKLLVTILLGLVIVSPASAQKSGEIKPVIDKTDGGYCEGAKAALDGFVIEAGKDGMIILIARLGKGETSRKFNHQRLRNIYYYLNVTREISQNRLVLAEGERERGLGRVEIYAQGKLMLVLEVKRNGDILGPKSCGLE